MRKTPKSQSQPVKVVGGSNFGRYEKISSEKTFNMFMTDGWLCNTAGYQKILTLFPAGEGRAIFVSTRGNIIIAVVNAYVYKLDSNLSPVVIGNLTTATGEVFIDENLSSQICLVDGVNAYIYNYTLGPNLTIQGGLGTLIPNYVTYHNTFFLFGNADTTTNGAAWYAYQRASDTTITQATPGQFALQTKPDFAKAVVRLPGQSANVLVFGTTVCEIWTQVGGLENYRKNRTFGVDYGCISVSTIAASDKFVAWLATNKESVPVIMVYSGQGFEPISTDGIDYQLSQIQYPAQSTAMFYRQDGHLFYQLTFFNEVDNLTILYDFTTKTFYNLSDAHLNYHPARNYVYFNNKAYFISLNNASVYESSTNFTTYNENLPTSVQDSALNLEIQRIRITDTVRADDSSQFVVNNFVFTLDQGNDPNVTGLSLLNNEDLLITEDAFNPPDDVLWTEFGIPIADEDSGNGLSLGDFPPAYRPRVDLSISRDGGVTWSNTVGRSLNPLGYRQNILNWERMGLCNSWTAKLRFWGTSKVVAFDGQAETY